MYKNNLGIFYDTLLKHFEIMNNFIIKLIDVQQQFTEACVFTVTAKRMEKTYFLSWARKISIRIESIIFEFCNRNLILLNEATL